MKRSGSTQTRKQLIRLFPYLFLAVGFGVPICLGLSWMPLPLGPFTPSGHPEGVIGTPAFPAALDVFSFAHLDWPSRLVEWKAFTSNEFPLWNPYSFLGVPFLAQYQNQMLFPLEWLEISTGPFVWSLLVPVKVIFAALGINLLLKTFSVSTPARACGVLIYCTSSYFMFFYSVPSFINGAAMLPWLFYAAAKLNTSEHPILWFSTTSVLVGLQWLTGQPQLSILSTLALMMFAVALSIQSVPQYIFSAAALRFIASRVGLMIAAVLVGLAIAAPQLSSTAELVFLERGYSFHYANAYTTFQYCYRSLTKLFFPLLSGSIMEDDKIPGSCANYFEGFPLYFGVIQFYVLAILLVHLDKILQNSLTRKLFLASLIVLLFFICWVILYLADATSPSHLPILGRVNFIRYCPPILACVSAILCGITIQNASSFSRWRIVLATGLSVLSIGTVLVFAWGQPLLTYASTRPEGMFEFIFGSEYPPGIAGGEGLLSAAWPSLPGPIAFATLAVLLIRRGNVSWSRERIGVVVLLCLAAEASLHFRYGLTIRADGYRLLPALVFVSAAIIYVVSGRLAGYLSLAAFGGLTAVIIASSTYHLAAHSRWEVEPPGYIRFLQHALGPNSRSGRVLNTYPARYALPPNIASAFGIAQFNGLAPINVVTTSRLLLESLPPEGTTFYGGLPMGWYGVSDRKADDVRTIRQALPDWSNYVERRSIYNFLGIRFLTDLESGPLMNLLTENVRLHRFYVPKLIYPAHRAIPTDSELTIVIAEDEQVLPRAFILKCVYPVANEDDAIELLRNVDFDPRTCAIIEDGDDGATNASKQIGRTPQRHVADASILHFGMNRVDIALTGTHEGLLVLTDSYYPGWRAIADGKEVPILRVNGIVRGVLVNSSMKTVTFEYWPTYMTASLWASSAALFLVVVTLLWPKMQRWRTK